MVRFNKFMFHIAAGLGHVRVIGHDEKGMLIIHQLFTFTYHRTNAVALLIQILQFLLFYDIVRFLLVCIIHITLQINHILQGSESGLLQKLPYAVLVSGFTAGVSFLQKISDMLHEISKEDMAENSFDAEELKRRIQEAIESLPEQYRDAFTLHRFSDKTYSEIADMYNVSPKTIDYRIQQALKILRKKLGDYLPSSLLAVVMSLLENVR